MDKRTNYRYYRIEDGRIIDTKDEFGYEVVEVGNQIDPPLLLKYFSEIIGFIVRMGDEVGNLVDCCDLVRFKSGAIDKVKPIDTATYDRLQGPAYSFETDTPFSRYNPEDVYAIFKPVAYGYLIIAYRHHDGEWVFPVKKPWTLQSDDEICGRK